jgi:hypothetical protein
MAHKLNYSEEKMIEMFSVREYTLLDVEYVHSTHKHNYICNKHVQFGVQRTALSHFKNGTGCKECANEKKRLGKKRRTTEEVIIIFNEKCLLLSENQIYKNNYQKLKYTCPSHPDVGEQEITLDGLLAKVRDGCPKCSRENSANIQKKNFNVLIEQVSELGYTVISKEVDYVNSLSPIKFHCEKHGEFKVAPSNLLFRKRCPQCGWDLNRRENHHSWNGGITSIRKSLRETLSEWKNKSLENSGYICDLTGTKKHLEVHHLYSFDLILKEVFNNLEIEIKEKIADYTEDEMALLKSEVLKIHYKYGLGVCLEKKVHKLFHTIYGHGENHPHQFEEFSLRYSLGEFDVLMLEKQMNKGVKE